MKQVDDMLLAFNTEHKILFDTSLFSVYRLAAWHSFLGFLACGICSYMLYV